MSDERNNKAAEPNYDLRSNRNRNRQNGRSGQYKGEYVDFYLHILRHFRKINRERYQ